MKEMNFPKLFIPGPTEVLEEVRIAQSWRVISHRSKDMSELQERVVTKIQKLFNTNHHCIVFTSSGTGVMEGAVRCLAEKRILHGICGAFGKRWYEISLANGKEADHVTVEMGKAIKPEMIAEKIEKGKYELVAVTHNETSTGVRNPTDDIAKIAKENDSLIAIDAVSSLGGDKIDVNKYDLVFTSSQKCFALPPGLAIALISQEAIEKAKKVPNRGYYFDFITMLNKYEKDKQYPTTPAVTLFYALDVQLDRMLKEGMDARYERHKTMMEMVHRWVKDRGFDIFAEKGYESVTVTTITNTKGISVKDLNSELNKRGMSISNGYGDLKEKTFRIAHMGEITPTDIRGLLVEIDDILQKKGVY